MRKPPTVPITITIAVAGLVLVAGCGNPPADKTAGSPALSSQGNNASASPVAGSAILWPLPPDPLERTVAAGLEPGPKEYGTNHVHAHVDVFVDGAPITIPGGIGIDITNPDVRKFDEPGGVGYGGIQLCAKPCISPLHTHDWTGIVHTESNTPKPNTLGEFFIEWGVALTDSCVGEFCSPMAIAFYVNGEAYTGDPSAIELTDQKEIAIVIGTPPPQIPSTADFSHA